MSNAPEPSDSTADELYAQASQQHGHGGGVEQLVRQIAAELQQRRPTEAVRLFLEGQAQGLIPSHDGLLRWVGVQLGDEDSRRLIRAFAHFPCMACNGGLEPCPLCGGDGMRDDGVVCEACIGGGRVRCDFCAGSGLATYNLVPSPLRLAVIMHRTNMARRQVEKLPGTSRPHHPTALLNSVLSCNKLWCVFENAVTAGKTMVAEHPSAAATVQPLIDGCRDSAEKVEAYVRTTLRELSAALPASSEPNHAAAQRAKADYYTRLADSETFDRTLLHHPLLSCD